MCEPSTYGRLCASTRMRRPWSSKTTSPSFWSSNASWYWKPEQPPPLTPTRRPAELTSAPWESRNSRTFSAPFSVKRTPLALKVTVVPVIAIQRIAIPSSANADDRRDQAPHRGGDPGQHRRGGGLDGHRRPSPCHRRLPRLLRPEPGRSASARLRRLRRGDRRTDPRAGPHHPSPGAGMSSDTNPIRDAIAEAIRDNKTILFMKGTPEAPACGFSARTVAALQSVGARFAAVDILPDPRIRQELSAISGWPTIPQLFQDGELVGGADIVG